MAQAKTIARPYAKAIFDIALENNALDSWSQVLSFLALIAENETIKPLYDDPNIAPEQLSSVFTDLLKEKKSIEIKSEMLKNFISVLSHYDRLSVLPHIAELFEETKAAYEKSSTVFVTSAFPMDDTVKEKLKKSLEIRLQRAVIMNYEQDKNLLGGAIIRAGDWVVDGSVRTKLEKLRQEVIS